MNCDRFTFYEFMFQLPYCVFRYRNVFKVISLSLFPFPCIPVAKFLASKSDRNDPIRIAASVAILVSVFFAGMYVIGQRGPAWPACSCALYILGLTARKEALAVDRGF